MSDEENLSREADTESEQESPETIALAREMGWKPEEEWKGPPPKNGHLSATEYVRRGEKILPIVNARARKAEERAAQLEQKLERMENDHRDTIRRIERMSSVALEQQRLQIAAQYGARKEAAVEVGDKEAYRQADKDEREAIKAIDERLKEETKPAADKPKELPSEVKGVIDAWIADNSWFNSDEEMNALAQARHMKLLKEKPGMTLRQNLDEVREYVRKRFPEKFGEAEEEETEDETPRRRGSPVEGGSRLGGGGGGSKYSKLPPEAKAICDKFIKDDGLFLKDGESVEKDLAKARERYAEQYLENA